MKRITQLVFVTALSASLLGCSAANSRKGSVSGNVTKRMQLVVDNLVSSYNTLDSVNFRRHFGPRLLVEATLGATGKLLRDSQRDNGKIEKYDIDASDNGQAAVVTFHMEKETYDIQLRLNESGRITLFDWTLKVSDGGANSRSDSRASANAQIDYLEFFAGPTIS